MSTRHVHALCQDCYGWAVPKDYFRGTRDGECCACGDRAIVIRVHAADVVVAENERAAAEARAAVAGW